MLALFVLTSCCNVQGCRDSNANERLVSHQPWVETHYSPSENLEAIDERVFRHAHQSIDLCAFSLTDRQLADVLVQAAGRGVRIRIYLDRGQTESESKREQGRLGSPKGTATEDETSLMERGTLERLQGNPNIQILMKHSKTLMHLKSYLVDRAILRSGSANFSPGGEKRQDNDLTLTIDSSAVERFERNFEVLWGRQDNEELP